MMTVAFAGGCGPDGRMDRDERMQSSEQGLAAALEPLAASSTLRRQRCAPLPIPATDDGAAPADYDGDGRIDLGFKDPTTGVWYIAYARDATTGWDFVHWSEEHEGYGGSDAHPVPADYDGDGRADLAIKTDDGHWYIDYAADGFVGWNVWGLPGYGGPDAHPVPADYDCDGRVDLAVKTDQGEWKIDYQANGFGQWDWPPYGTIQRYGGPHAHPVPADYDGDGLVDLAVKADGGIWQIDFSGNGLNGFDWPPHGKRNNYGGADAHPVPADYDGDGIADLAVKTDDGVWKIDYARNGFSLNGSFDETHSGYGNADAQPVPADYDGDGIADLAVAGNSCDTWYMDYASDGFGHWDASFFGCIIP
jgi:hypothetical protein